MKISSSRNKCRRSPPLPPTLTLAAAVYQRLLDSSLPSATIATVSDEDDHGSSRFFACVDPTRLLQRSGYFCHSPSPTQTLASSEFFRARAVREMLTWHRVRRYRTLTCCRVAEFRRAGVVCRVPCLCPSLPCCCCCCVQVVCFSRQRSIGTDSHYSRQLVTQQVSNRTVRTNNTATELLSERNNTHTRTDKRYQYW